jgi:hypothetical protein
MIQRSKLRIIIALAFHVALRLALLAQDTIFVAKMVEARGIEPLSLGESNKASTGIVDWKFSATSKAVHDLMHA